MKKFTALLNLITVPIVILNTIGALVSFLWLAFSGEWSLIIYGILYMFVATFILGILLLPSVGIGLLMVKAAEKKVMFIAATLGLLSLAYTYLLMIYSSFYVFGFAVSNSAESTALFPVLIWAFVVASAPWAGMASKEENDSTFFSLLSLEFALLVALVLIGVISVPVDEAFGYVLLIMILPLIFGSVYAYNTFKNGGENILSGEAVNNSGYSKDELTAIVVALVMVAHADGRLRAKEISEIQEVFREITGENISRKFIKNANANLAEQKNEEAILFDLASIQVDISDDTKYKIVRGMCFVASSDGEFHKREKLIIARIAKTLGMNKSVVSEAIHEAAKV